MAARLCSTRQTFDAESKVVVQQPARFPRTFDHSVAAFSGNIEPPVFVKNCGGEKITAESVWRN